MRKTCHNRVALYVLLSIHDWLDPVIESFNSKLFLSNVILNSDFQYKFNIAWICHCIRTTFIVKI